MDRHDSYDPHDFYYNNAEDDGQSEDGEDDIVYAENGNYDADKALQWTTTSTSQALNDEDATQRSVGSQSQFSQSRVDRRSLPSLITRRERRLLRRQAGRKAAVDFSEEGSNRSASENESQHDDDDSVEEEGDEIFASVRDLMGGKDCKEIMSPIHTSSGRTRQHPDGGDGGDNPADENKAHSDSHSDQESVDFESSHNRDGSERSPSQLGTSNNCHSTEEGDAWKSKHDTPQKALTTDDRESSQSSKNAGGMFTSTASFAAGPSSPQMTDTILCDSSSGIIEEPNQRDDVTAEACSQTTAKVGHEASDEFYNPCTHVQNEFNPPNAGIDDDGKSSMERIMRQAKKHNRPQKKPQRHITIANEPDEFLESQEHVLVTARKDRKWRQKRSREVKSSRAKNVVPTCSFSQSSTPQGFRTRDELTQVAEAKSIVGSRPTHWGGSSINLSSKQKRLDNRNTSSARAVALSQATRMRIMPTPSRLEVSNNRKNIRHGGPKPASQSSIRTDTQKARRVRKGKVPSVTQLSQSDAEPNSQRASRDSGWKQNADIRCAKFAPSFLAQTRNSHLEPVSNTSPESPVTFGSNPLHATKAGDGLSPYQSEAADHSRLSSYKTRSSRSSSSRKRKKAGFLMTKLRRIRCAVDGDDVRFQSGAYPFQPTKRRTDLNDPRNRADSFADVSIVGEPLPWNRGEKRVTVLGYVHFASSKTKTLKHKAGIPSNAGSCLQSNSDGNGARVREYLLHSFPCFLWVCFTFDTVQSKKIGCGVQLRIYNAIVIHPQCVTETLPTLLSTQICELYPKALPSLPSPPEYDGNR